MLWYFKYQASVPKNLFGFRRVYTVFVATTCLLITAKTKEPGFRTMKTAFLETRPIFVRKEKRTRGHVFVVMLAYIIIHELQKLWANEDITVQEGIKELSTINSVEVKIGEKSYHQIPKPRKLGEILLKLANVTLPHAIISRHTNVATKRKLPERRKRHIIN